jgi:hypothetical protein
MKLDYLGEIREISSGYCTNLKNGVVGICGGAGTTRNTGN